MIGCGLCRRDAEYDYGMHLDLPVPPREDP